MTPENLLRAMCERHGLPAEYGRRLLPLVRRAMEAPDEVRERILALVDGNLANRAGASEIDDEESERERSTMSADAPISGAPARASSDEPDSNGSLGASRACGASGTHGAMERDADHDILVAIARVLHGWSPSQSMSDFGSSLGGLGAAQSDES